MSVRVKINIEGFLEWAKQEPNRVTYIRNFFTHRGGHLVTHEMRNQTPKRSGFLRQTIGYEPTPTGFIVSVGAHYGIFVERGTERGDIIRPIHAKALAFMWKGKQRFFKKVKAKGFLGRFFVRRTIDIVKPKLHKLVANKWWELHRKETQLE